MSQPYDVIVVGLGGMGSATAYQLALRGVRVLGLERHTPAHSLGSSHGQSRIIRQAYFEDPAYVPLLLRAYELWRQIERETGRELLTVTGGLMLGQPTSQVVAGALRSAQEWQLAHEVLDAADIRRRFPVFQPGPDVIALYEALAGFVRPEDSVAAHLDRAARLGADLHFAEPVTAWAAAPGGEGSPVFGWLAMCLQHCRPRVVGRVEQFLPDTASSLAELLAPGHWPQRQVARAPGQ